MKRTIAFVLALATIAVPAALADPPASRSDAHQTVVADHASVVADLVPPDRIDGKGTLSNAPADPVARIVAQERGRALDPRLFSTPGPIEIVQSGGFHWGDAGIGAGTAFGLILLALGMTLVVRSERVRSA